MISVRQNRQHLSASDYPRPVYWQQTRRGTPGRGTDKSTQKEKIRNKNKSSEDRSTYWLSLKMSGRNSPWIVYIPKKKNYKRLTEILNFSFDKYFLYHTFISRQFLYSRYITALLWDQLNTQHCHHRRRRSTKLSSTPMPCSPDLSSEYTVIFADTMLNRYTVSLPRHIIQYTIYCHYTLIKGSGDRHLYKTSRKWPSSTCGSVD